MPASPPRSIAVLGAGITGLASAFRLARQGHRVTVYEASENAGGLGTFFEHEGRTFEKFYHCLLPSDAPLLRLLAELGLQHDLYWKPTTFAYSHENQTYPLNSALDLLRFRPLPFLDRLRVGFTGLFGRLVSERGLDEVTTVDWLTRLSGRRAFHTFWQPMLEAKFGDRYHDVPALWFWTRFNREKGESAGERKGYLQGGYKRIIDTLITAIESHGGRIHLRTPVRQVELAPDETLTVTSDSGPTTFDQLLITLPTPQLIPLVGPRLRARLPSIDTTTDYQGVINTLLFLKRPLTPHYWVATPESRYPFDGVVETSTLTNEADRGPRHVVYLTKYLHRSDDRFHQSDSDLVADWIPALKRLFPDLRNDEIEAIRIFRAPFVEPIYRLRQTDLRPPEELLPGRVYLSNTAQVYPTVTSWNGSMTQVERTLESITTPPPPSPARTSTPELATLH